MSMADDFRDQREYRRMKQRQHSNYCLGCGARVWDQDEQCPRCDTDNPNFRSREES